jgi:hypothetical protein
VAKTQESHAAGKVVVAANRSMGCYAAPEGVLQQLATYGQFDVDGMWIRDLIFS